jgi:hypothetical protein
MNVKDQFGWKVRHQVEIQVCRQGFEKVYRYIGRIPAGWVRSKVVSQVYWRVIGRFRYQVRDLVFEEVNR